MKLFIKNMVCNRCKMVVRSLTEKFGLTPISVELGEIEIAEQEIPPAIGKTFAAELIVLGFELIDDKQSRIISKIKSLIIDLVHHKSETTRLKHSEYIASNLHYDYPYLSRLFSEVEGTTIEQYIITQKIEKAKELLVYDELNISEIAYELEYSSVAHLSTQFKKITGMTPTQFKALHYRPRRSLDEVGK